MADAKTIGISALSALIISLGVIITPQFFESPHYYCSARPELGFVNCDTLSKYYGLDNGQCNVKDQPAKRCSTGWLLVTNDLNISAMPEATVSKSMKEICTINGCEEIN